MEDPCFCSFSSFVNCLVDKTKISLPVVMTACALGYIWAAKKQMTDIKRQCDVLEEDLKNIKRENFHLGEEIRYLKCTSSDTELLPIMPKSCPNEKFRRKPKTSLCYDKKRFSDSCATSKARRRKRSPVCELSEIVSYSTPEVSIESKYDFPSKLPSRNRSSARMTSLEWSPAAESTRIHRNSMRSSRGDRPCGYSKKPDKVSFNERPYKSINSKKSIYPKEKYPRSACGRRPSSPKRTFNYNSDCCPLVSKPRTPPCCNIYNETISSSPCFIKRTCSRQIKNFDNTSTYHDSARCKSPTRCPIPDTNVCTKSKSRCTKIKEKIDKCRNEITKDLSVLAVSDPGLCSDIDLSNDPDAIDLTGVGKGCETFEYKCTTRKLRHK